MELKPSKKEISRRKKAFSTLLASLFLGTFLASKIFGYSISGLAFLLIAVMFLVFGFLTFRFLGSILKSKLNLSENGIERTNLKSSESFLFSDIKNIKIKRRTTGEIREIYIWLDNKKSIFLTAFEENFENIKDVLADKKRNNVAIKEIREPINYDHPLFYAILGLPISFLGIYFLKFISNIGNITQTKIIFYILSFYTFALGIYFILKKPQGVRHGNSRITLDYALGFLMICASFFILFTGLNL